SSFGTGTNVGAEGAGHLVRGAQHQRGITPGGDPLDALVDPVLKQRDVFADGDTYRNIRLAAGLDHLLNCREHFRMARVAHIAPRSGEVGGTEHPAREARAADDAVDVPGRLGKLDLDDGDHGVILRLAKFRAAQAAVVGGTARPVTAYALRWIAAGGD